MPHDHGSSASFFVGSMLAFWIAGFAPDWRPALAGWSANSRSSPMRMDSS